MTETDTAAQNTLPLCVDMDGTLLLTDTLWEACLRLARQNPFMIFLFPFWLLKGKAGFKHSISQHLDLAPDSLPYNSASLSYLAAQRLAGRRLLLVTSANQRIADSVAGYLNIFDEVLASDSSHNLTGHNKAAALVKKFGEQGFVYAGNESVDLSVWQRAAAAVVVNAPDSLVAQAEKVTTIEHIMPSNGKPSLLTLLETMRIHQWSKNLLIFMALVLSHSWADLDSLWSSILAFIAFGFCASAAYLINDLLDLEADRIHPIKKLRPLAAGTLPVQWGVFLVPILLIVSFLFAITVGNNFVSVLIIYFVLSTAYSLFLKQVAILDMLVLTSLYTLRVIAGTVAISVPLSYWLLAFSMFIFLSLALAKRYSELRNLLQREDAKASARGYLVIDLPAISLFGISSGYLSVMVLVLYIHDLQSTVLYSQPDWLWLVSFAILYWVSHIWLLTHRGQMNEDPVLFAIHDPPSYIVSLLVVISLLLAL